MKVFPDQKQVVLPYRPDVENILTPTTARRFEARGQPWLAIPHKIDTVRVLRSMGINAPSPILYDYDWADGSPFVSQRDTAALLTLSPRCYVLSEMGVGKTRAILWAFDYLRRIKMVKRMLVSAPLSTLVSVWENEVFENFHHLTTGVLYGDRKKRLKILAEPADIYIINHDGLEVISRELSLRSDIDTLVIDELAIFRNARSARWRFAKPLADRARYAWGLTGSATPNAPTDAYGQVKLLTPARVGYSFKSFRDRTMRKVSNFRWVAKRDANEAVLDAMQPSIRFTRDQCFDLPETTYTTRQVELAPATLAAYKKMMDDLQVQVRRKEINAANEGVKLMKLMQIASGFAYDAAGEGQYIGGTERIRQVLELIEEAGAKVIVFANFRYLVELYAGVIAKSYSCVAVHGDTPKGIRDQAYLSFQRATDPHVLVAHPGTMAHGLTLTAANTIIWASPSNSLEIYEQANARITRSGQKNCTQIVHIEGTKVEKQVYDRLRRKAKMQGALLDLFEQDTLNDISRV